MSEIEKLLKVLETQQNRGHEKIEISCGMSNAFIEIKPIREAIKKQISEPVERNRVYKDDFECPECGGDLDDWEYAYCGFCGQKLIQEGDDGN